MVETEIQKRVNKNGMVISRIPSWAREFIYEDSIAEHSGDYGACIAFHLRNSIEYMNLKTKFLDNQLDVKINLSEKTEKIKQNLTNLKFGNGKIIKLEEKE